MATPHRPEDESAGTVPAAGQPDWLAARLKRWWPDLLEALEAVYGREGAGALAERLHLLAAQAAAERPAELVRLDLDRTLRPDWFQDSAMVGYAAYADRFAGDLAGVRERIGYLRELGVTYLHLMPLLAPRLGDSDGGYAVADYYRVRPDLGTMDDLVGLAGELRRAGISLVLDLVLNHVAREHPWAEAARAGDEYYRGFFHLFADRSGPDAYEATLPEVFPDFAPGNFSWDGELGAWVWTTFNAFQWDLNWANPEVFYRFAEIILFLANQGVEVLRLDAIAFLWKRLGTDCQNQPEVHLICRALRALSRVVAPAVIFKAEAIVGPAELIHYLGTGVNHAKLSDLAYHNSLMVQIWSMLAARDVRLAAGALSALPAKPTTAAWITYLRCHDDIGWAISDADAAAAGLDGHAHRSFLSDYYAGLYPGSPARGLVFQANPVTGDRRISGTAASLAGLEAASGDPEAESVVIDRLLMAYAVVLGWGGIPVIWMGDELALTNDPQWAAEPGHGDDNRWAHRPRMDWERAARRKDEHHAAGRMWSGLGHLLSVRAQTPHLHASVESEVLPVADPGILGVLRRHPLGPMVQLYNVTETWRPYPLAVLRGLGLGDGVDLLGERPVGAASDGTVWIRPYGTLWIVEP